MTIKEYIEISNFITTDEIVEIDVWRKGADGEDKPLNLESLTDKQIMKTKLKDLEIKSVDVYPSGCGSWGGFIRLDINVK